jgi:hypothetical protein
MLWDKPWMLKIPSAGDFIGIFTLRSGWYDSYTLFSDMKKWLEGKSDMENAKLWGKTRTRYTFKDFGVAWWWFGEERDRVKVKMKKKAARSVSKGNVKKREKKKKKKTQSDKESSGFSL